MAEPSRTTVLKDKATGGKDLAVALAQDKKFRKKLISELSHGRVARRRARRIATIAAVTRFAADQRLVGELRHAADSLQRVVTRAEEKRSHRLRNSLILVGAGGAAVAIALPPTRRWLAAKLGLGGGSSSRTVTEWTEIGVPVSTAYNQWTQFEDLPLFMEGVEHVQQLDDNRLHWVATIAGRKAEWDAKIVKQKPDRLISWVSEDNKQTHGTVTFKPLGDSRTLISLSLSYPPEAEGSSVEGDLERFKELIEARNAEIGAWPSEVSERTATP
jgi:uncharacterized membrane protein